MHPKTFLLSITSILILLFNLQCKISPPSAPQWDVDVNIPVINKTFYVSDLIDGIEGLKVDSLNQIFVEFTAELDTFDARNQLTLNGLSQQFSKALGRFKIPSPGERELTVQLNQIYPAADQLNGVKVPVPPFNFQLPTQDLPPFETIQWVEIDSGFVDLTIENFLPVDLGKPITIELLDAAADTVIADWVFPDFIQVGKSQTERLELKNKRLSAALALRVAGGSPGSADSVLIQSDDYFRIGVLLSDLYVSGGAAKLDPQRIQFDEKIQIADSLVIASARIRQGQMRIEVSGNLPIDASVNFNLPDFIDEKGAPLTETFFLLKDQVNQLVLDLSGYRFLPENGDFASQAVRISASVATLQSPDELIELFASDSVSVLFDISQIYFSEISGRFYSKQIEVPEKTIEVDLPSRLDSIRLDAAQLQLRLLNSIGFPAQVNLRIRGTNDAGGQAEVLIDQTIQPGGGQAGPESTEIVLNQENSGILDLLNLLPSRIEVSGKVQVGRPDWIGTIRETDFVTGEITFTAPAALELPAQKFESDVSNMTLDQDVRNTIQTRLDEGELMVKTVSHLPIGAQIYMNFALEDSSVFQNPQLRIGPVSIESGVIDPATKTVAMPRENQINIKLSREEMQFFANSPIFTGVEIDFPGTQGQVVQLLSSDYLDIQAVVRLQVKVGETQSSAN